MRARFESVCERERRKGGREEVERERERIEDTATAAVPRVSLEGNRSSLAITRRRACFIQRALPSIFLSFLSFFCENFIRWHRTRFQRYRVNDFHAFLSLSSFSFFFLLFISCVRSLTLNGAVFLRRSYAAPKYPRDSTAGAGEETARYYSRREQAPTTMRNVYSTIYRVWRLSRSRRNPKLFSATAVGGAVA